MSQLAWLQHRARAELLRRVKIQKAIVIQRIARGRRGRKRAAFFKRRRDNLRKMQEVGK